MLSTMLRHFPRIIFFPLFFSGLFFLALILQYPLSTENFKTSLALKLNAQPKLSETNITEKKVLLVWTTIFKAKTGSLEDCPLKDLCILTFDQKMVDKANAVIFYMDRHDFDWSSIPSVRHSHQRYVFMLQEAPHDFYLSNANIIPRFFNWTMTYRQDSDIPMPYGGWWIRPEERASVSPDALAKEDLSYDKAAVLAQKTGLVLWLVSNCNTMSKRELIVEALQKNIQIDVFGACASTAEKKKYCPKSQSPDHRKCNKLFSRYKFFIAFENAICKDYVSEKYWVRYESMSVPIVLRRWVYEPLIPVGSFIAVDDFPNPAALADHLRYLDGNDTAYMEYFEWRNKGYDRARYNGPGYRSGYCRACEKVLEDDGRISIIENAAHWFSDEAHCDRKGEFAQTWIRSREKRV